MTDEIRRVAREARRWGLRATELGNQTDAQWRDFRERFACEHFTPLMLADMTDLVLRLEAGRDAEWG